MFVFVLLRRDIGNVYIGDYSNHRVRKVTYGTTAGPSAAPTYTPTKSPSYQPTYIPSCVPTAIPTVASVITTVAGTGTASYSGDSGAATSATLNYPSGVAVDSSGEQAPCSSELKLSFHSPFLSLGNIFIADELNNLVRKVTVSTGIITTVMTGSSPWGVAVDASGNVYSGDTNSHTVKKYTSSTASTSTIAGISGSSGYSGDGGAATSATLFWLLGVALDSTGRQLTHTLMYVRLICHF